VGSTPGSTAGAAAGAFGAIGNLISGFSTAGELNAKSQIARNNSLIAAQNARMAMATGESRAEAQGLKTRARLGEIKAQQGAGGIDVNSGSAADVRASAAKLGALDALTIRSNAARQAYGLDLESQGELQQSKLYRKGAKIAPWEGAFNAVGSLLGSASQLSSQAKTWGSVAGTGEGGGGDLSLQTNDAGEAIWD
jgi:hypothetical protein